MSCIVVLLPIYNEEARLERLLDRLQGSLASKSYRIVAVDDGSADASPAILKRRGEDLPIATITHAGNRGLAQTLYDGLCWVAEHCDDDDVVIMMDADDTHDPRYIAPLLARLGEGYDVVIASRFQPGGAAVGVALHRRLYSYGARLLLGLLLPVRDVRDFSSGYRAIRVAMVRRALRQFGDRILELRDWGFVCTAELLWKLQLAGARCAEIPLVLRYDLKEGRSHMRVLRTIAGYLLLAWRARQDGR